MSPDRLPGELVVLLSIFGALGVGLLIRLPGALRSDDEAAKTRLASVLSWWMLAVVLAGAVLFRELGACILLAAVSIIGFREWARLTATRYVDRVASVVVMVGIPILYLAIYRGVGPTALAPLPAVSLLLIVVSQISRSQVGGYIRSTGGLLYGVLTIVFGLAHAALVATSPEQGDSRIGWFVYLVVLTELNDIAQALVGRRLGRHPITPKASPHKSWEGWAGGVVVTIVLAVVLAPGLTQLAPLRAAVAGLVISVTGFLGDINVSAVKRDARVKDSSELLPGIGGMLDRIDSLTFTAPAFYWLIVAPPW